MSTIVTMQTLLRSGISTGQVWSYSEPARSALNSVDQAQLELVWQFAQRVGAPLGEVLEQLHNYQRDQQRLDRELNQAAAAPEATRRLLLWLPVVALGFGQLAGINVLAALRQPLGLAAVAVAALLLWVAARWSRSFLEIERPAQDDSLMLLLMQLALRAGLGLAAAKALVSQAMGHSQRHCNFDLVDDELKLSAATGAALADLLLAKAIDLRENQASAAIAAAQRASVRLLIPLGLTALPAFLILTVTPVLISVLGNQ